MWLYPNFKVISDISLSIFLDIALYGPKTNGHKMANKNIKDLNFDKTDQ